MSREELIEGEGGFENIETRWMDGVDDTVRRAYIRGKEYQIQYPPNSLPTDITLSQFLSIQEKGVSAWCFEPDYETVNSLLVHARTEITFLPDPASSSCVQSNLPLPKLNEVYYWEVKMFDLPETTTVSVGLATKPYPPFRLPGLNRYSIAYHSNGEKSHNYPFTATPFGPALKEGDVLGVGYRPRTGTVFFTRNGRKTEDAFVGLGRWNLFPTIGADGPCSVHVNLGQAGFVFIEANVKKWGLAPSVGTLAPPPAYGSERGSILLDVGGRIRSNPDGTPSSTAGASSSPSSTHRHRFRRPRQSSGTAASPLRSSLLPETPITPPPPITPIDEEPDDEDSASDDPSAPLLNNRETTSIRQGRRTGAGASRSPSPTVSSRSHDAGARNPFTNHRHQLSSSRTHFAASLSVPSRGSGSELTVQLHPPPDSPMSPNINPPTRARSGASSASTDSGDPGSASSTDRLLPSSPLGRRDPPAYSPLDAYTYADGVQIDLPAEVIAAALEGSSVPPTAIGQSSNSSRSSDRRRSRRR
ncbi:concanavalin A-like lectin/glucanase domain-containing protein [Gymnopilus junonius]|uniref:Concanavalin A-like lectin/glucanase domain-containing protein n=1 Tax=Gymnopilus junonius TaxID=109634 RepID=A0A9P5TU32_GYMJU|nr:concanavalin A-like lectin/glucanase domain-containing protein [Gymnopilus junonius]